MSEAPNTTSNERLSPELSQINSKLIALGAELAQGRCLPDTESIIRCKTTPESDWGRVSSALDGIGDRLRAYAVRIREIADSLPRSAHETKAKSHPYLCDATRFKLSFDRKGRVNSFYGYEKQLDGVWVALVYANDDAHMRGYSSEKASAQHKHWCAKLAPPVYAPMGCNCGAVKASAQHKLTCPALHGAACNCGQNGSANEGQS